MPYEPIIIKHSKKRNLLYLFWTLVLIFFSCAMFFIDLWAPDSLLRIYKEDIASYNLCNVLCVFMFFVAICTFFLFLKMAIAGKDVLVIDDRGITDNGSFYNCGFIPWSNIDRAYIGEVMKNYFIELALIDEDKYLSQLNPVKRQLHKLNKSLGHEIICITLGGVYTR